MQMQQPMMQQQAMMQQPLMQQPMMMQHAAPVMWVYVPPTGYVMPQPQCIPPNTYQLPADPNVYNHNVVWKGTYRQDD